MSKVAPVKDFSQIGFHTNLVQPQFADWTGFRYWLWHEDDEYVEVQVVRRLDWNRWVMEWVSKPNNPNKPMIWTHEMLVHALLHYVQHAALYLYQEKGMPMDFEVPYYYLEGDTE